MLHYGNELAINNITYYDFNKIELKANKFNPLECPPWSKKNGTFTSGLLPFPPSPLSFDSKVGLLQPPPGSETLLWTCCAESAVLGLLTLLRALRSTLAKECSCTFPA